MIEVRKLCFSYGKNPVLKDVDFVADKGSLIAVLGPNGVGKSTLFKCMLGFLKPTSGSVSINGKDVPEFSRRELASEIAYIPQNYNPVFNHTVMESVLMGATHDLALFDMLQAMALRILYDTQNLFSTFSWIYIRFSVSEAGKT